MSSLLVKVASLLVKEIEVEKRSVCASDSLLIEPVLMKVVKVNVKVKVLHI